MDHAESMSVNLESTREKSYISQDHRDVKIYVVVGDAAALCCKEEALVSTGDRRH